MLNFLISNKIELTTTFLMSFGIGTFFVDNQELFGNIGNFIGSILATILIRLIDRKTRKKNKKDV